MKEEYKYTRQQLINIAKLMGNYRPLINLPNEIRK